MGILQDLQNLLGGRGGSSQTCPGCGTEMSSDDGERFECPQCTFGGVYFLEDGELVDSMKRGRGSSVRKCEMCNSSLKGGQSYLPYEDGGNTNAYVVCPSCSHKNEQHGFGGDD